MFTKARWDKSFIFNSIRLAGNGCTRHSLYLTTRGHRIIGVDRSPAMLAQARRKFPHVDFHEGPQRSPRQRLGGCCRLCVSAVPPPHAGAGHGGIRPGGAPRRLSSRCAPLLILLGCGPISYRQRRGGVHHAAAHLLSLPQAFAAAGFRVRGCYEPRLTPEAAGTVVGAHVPEAHSPLRRAAAWSFGIWSGTATGDPIGAPVIEFQASLTVNGPSDPEGQRRMESPTVSFLLPRGTSLSQNG